MNFENWPINPGDLVILVVVLLSALLAFARGFVRELLTIVSWIGAAVVALFTFDRLRPYVAEYVTDDPTLSGTIAGAAIFIVALIVFSIVSHLIAGGVRRSSISAVDRSLGFLFGVARGAVLVCLGFLLLQFLYEGEDGGQLPGWAQGGKLLPWVERGAAYLQQLVPDSAIDETLQQAGDGLDGLRGAVLPLPAGPPAPGNQTAAEPGETGYTADQREDMIRAIGTAN